MKTYKFIVNTLCCLIPFRHPRHKMRDKLMEYYWLPQSVIELAKYKTYKIPQKSVLIIEPNYFHGEVVPGIAKYIQELGYTPVIILHPQVRRDNPFCRWAAHPTVFYMMPDITRRILKQTRDKFEFVFLTSHTLWSMRYFGPYIKYLGFVPDSKHKYMAIEHDTSFIKKFHQEQNKSRLFTLTGFDDTSMLNPHYFGETPATPRNQDTTIFFAVVNQQSAADKLFSATRNLLKQGQRNFRVIIGGRTCIKKIPTDLQNVITLTGFLTFKQLWNWIDKSDFFIFGMDAKNETHRRYTQTTVTGSLQTVLAFAKPGIIEPEFATAYKLDDDVVIIDENLANAMTRALNMSHSEYQKMQDNIKKLADKITNESLRNLETKITHRDME